MDNYFHKLIVDGAIHIRVVQGEMNAIAMPSSESIMHAYISVLFRIKFNRKEFMAQIYEIENKR